MGEPVAAVAAATRELARDAAELIEVVYDELPVLVDARGVARRRRSILHDEAGSNVVLVGRLRLGRRRHRARRGGSRREDRQAPLPPLLVDAARVRGAPRRVRQGHRSSGRSTATTRCPASARSGWRRRCALGSTSSASSRRTSAAASATRSACTRSTSSSASWRGSSDRPSSGRSGAPTSAHGERARQRALVPGRRGRR